MKNSLQPPGRILVFNLATDLDHPVLGFTSYWIRALADQVGQIDVLTMQAGKIDLPKNVRVYSVGKERGFSKARRAVEFYKLLSRLLSQGPVDGCFSHMITIFSVMAAPVLKMKGIPLVTWYAHPSLTPTLKWAHFCSDRMVTSLPRAYPYRADKLSVIGQGIDTLAFAPDPAVVPEDNVVLCVGRISPVKDHLTLVRALTLIPGNVQLRILGATTSREDETYRGEILRQAQQLGVSDRVILGQPVPPDELPRHFQRCAVHVNLTPAGFGDKVAWEAMACGRPCLVANTDFEETLGRYSGELLFKVQDPVDLAAKLRALLEMSSGERACIGEYLRGRVQELHSLPRLASRVIDELRTVAAARR
jgi:glycosyltransferase involved in cell wall biosynthesis